MDIQHQEIATPIFDDSLLQKIGKLRRRWLLFGWLLLIGAPIVYLAFMMRSLRDEHFLSSLLGDLSITFFAPIIVATTFYRKWPMICAFAAMCVLLMHQIEKLFSFNNQFLFGAIFLLPVMSFFIGLKAYKMRLREKRLQV